MTNRELINKLIELPMDADILIAAWRGIFDDIEVVYNESLKIIYVGKDERDRHHDTCKR